MLGGAVSDGGDWIHSDHSDDDELQQLAGAGRIGEYPPRIRWLQKRHLMTLRMAVDSKCARPQIRDPPHSRKRNGLRISNLLPAMTRLDACHYRIFRRWHGVPH